MSHQAARDREYREAVQRQVEKLLRSTPYHSLQLPDGTIIPGLIGMEALEQRVASFPIPTSLRGCRVLDVGAASGWNAFAMAARGARVTAVDCVEFEELGALKALIAPEIDYRILDVDELSPASVGTFDYVLFFGVLYHLRHPLLSLEKICALTNEMAFVESFVSDPVECMSDACSMEFYENDDLGGQIDNWYGPTAKCLMALCRSAGFVRVRLEYVANRRAGVTCHRRWEPEPETPSSDAPWLFSAVNNRTSDVYFHLGKDEYLCIYFRSPEAPLTRDQIRIEVDGYGVNALAVHHRKTDEWQVNARLPSGIALGEHQVRLRTETSRFNNSFRISVVDGYAAAESGANAPSDARTNAGPPPLILGIENSQDGSTVFHGYATERLSCRFASVTAELCREAMEVSIDAPPAGRFVPDKPWQRGVGGEYYSASGHKSRDASPAPSDWQRRLEWPDGIRIQPYLIAHGRSTHLFCLISFSARVTPGPAATHH